MQKTNNSNLLADNDESNYLEILHIKVDCILILNFTIRNIVKLPGKGIRRETLKERVQSRTTFFACTKKRYLYG